MSSPGNNLLAGFLIFSVLFFAVALLLRHDAAVDPGVDVQQQGVPGVAHAKEDPAAASAVDMQQQGVPGVAQAKEDPVAAADVEAMANAADSSASAPAPAGTRGPHLTLASYDLEKPARRFKLPKRLREISGLAMLAGNRLLAHDDERGVVVEIDYPDGSIVKAFSLGGRDGRVADDFEGIAAAEGRLYLVTSAGRLYEFGEGPDGATVPYKLYETGIGRDYELEGLAYDPDQRVLLLVSKNPRKSRLEGLIAIYRWSPDTRQFAEVDRILLEASALARRIESKRFQPSGIERHPVSGNYFVVAARQGAVAEITPQGQILAVAELAAGRHPQAEGISFASDNTLIIADEGGGKRARLSFYPVAKGR